MQYIQHRVNTLLQLKELEAETLDYGVEIDIRSDGKDLLLEHDSFWTHRPELLESYLSEYNQKGPIIANLKCEGIEERCLELFSKYSLQNFFFLDMSMPFFVKYANRAERDDGLKPENLAVRFSEFESKEYAMGFQKKAGWLWVDCFQPRLDLSKQLLQEFQKAGFKICLVSPELQKHGLKFIADFKDSLNQLELSADAVCTKRPDLWK